MSQETLNYFIKKGFLLDKDLLEFFSGLNDNALSEEILNRISMLSRTRVITKAMFAVYFNEIKPLLFELSKIQKEKIDHLFRILPAEKLGSKEDRGELKNKDQEGDNEGRILNPKFRVLSSNIIPYRKIEVKDFVTHFKNRYNFLKDLLKNRTELKNLVSINKIGTNRDFSVIGIVSGKRITKNKNLFIELEDLTGRISALVNQNKPEVFEKAKEILLDDVIGVRCSGNGEMLFVNDLFFPESSITEKRKAEEETYALFISDIHLGSKNFLEKNFSRFIDWLNGIGCSEEQKRKVEKIKYIFMVGDNIDGVGIYPSQEERLIIKDIKDQYAILTAYLEKVPKQITMIMCPGQHDAVRVPEPQPPIDEEFGGNITKIKNLFLVSNPALVEIECNGKRNGLKVLMYHGASLHSWIDEIEELRVGKANLNPAKVIKYLLRHRHLSPTHLSTTYVPSEKEDFLVIKEVPDIIATGEMHKADIDLYNNTLIICSSCWQSATPYEEKVGNQPDPCKIPMLNLKTRELKILDFSESFSENEKKNEGEQNKINQKQN